MDVHNLTITQVKEDLKNKLYTSEELTKAYLERVRTVDPKLNAFITVTGELALQRAKQADEMIASGQEASLLGIPLSIKDNFCTEGTRTTASSFVLEDFIPPYSATVVDKLQNAGSVFIGKTNMDAWAHGSSTETSDFGATKNPWDITKLPGGSSGGSAASVAADEVLASIGSETAGSIRQPASWCGVVGLKPTYGRVSRYGVIAMGSSLDSPGPITKSVEDAALILEVLAGFDPKDATSSASPIENYTQSLKKPMKKMIIGVSADYFEGVDKVVIQRIEEAIAVLKKLGHIVKDITLLSPQISIDVYTIIQRAEVSSNLARYDGIRYGFGRKKFGEEAKRRVILGTYVLSSGYYDAYYLKAQKVRTLIIKDFAKAFEQVDVIIAPTSPSTALPIGSSKDHPMFGEIADVLVEPSSIAGLTGISIPVGFTREQLPVGMQIIGPQFAEKRVLNLAHQYEHETAWRLEKPRL